MDRHGAGSLSPALDNEDDDSPLRPQATRSFASALKCDTLLTSESDSAGNVSTVMNKQANKRGVNDDRRIEDIGPPDGWRDRRRHVERRIPTAEEVEVSAEDWETYFVKPAKKTTPTRARSSPLTFLSVFANRTPASSLRQFAALQRQDEKRPETPAFFFSPDAALIRLLRATGTCWPSAAARSAAPPHSARTRWCSCPGRRSATSGATGNR